MRPLPGHRGARSVETAFDFGVLVCLCFAGFLDSNVSLDCVVLCREDGDDDAVASGVRTYDNIDGGDCDECRGGNRLEAGMDGVTSENDDVDERACALVFAGMAGVVGC